MTVRSKGGGSFRRHLASRTGGVTAGTPWTHPSQRGRAAPNEKLQNTQQQVVTQESELKARWASQWIVDKMAEVEALMKNTDGESPKCFVWRLRCPTGGVEVHRPPLALGYGPVQQHTLKDFVVLYGCVFWFTTERNDEREGWGERESCGDALAGSSGTLEESERHLFCCVVFSSPWFWKAAHSLQHLTQGLRVSVG